MARPCRALCKIGSSLFHAISWIIMNFQYPIRKSVSKATIESIGHENFDEIGRKHVVCLQPLKIDGKFVFSIKIECKKCQEILWENKSESIVKANNVSDSDMGKKCFRYKGNESEAINCTPKTETKRNISMGEWRGRSESFLWHMCRLKWTFNVFAFIREKFDEAERSYDKNEILSQRAFHGLEENSWLCDHRSVTRAKWINKNQNSE